MKLLKILLLIFIIMPFYTDYSHGADIAKIGVVDFQRILKESDAGKAVALKLRQKQEERTTALKEKQKEIITLQKNIEDANFSGDKAIREKRQAELDARLEVCRKLESDFSNALREINTTASDKIRREVAEVIVRIGKIGGYLLIIEKSDLLYSPETVDITSKVVAAYNKSYSGR